MGPEFVEFPPFDLTSAFKDSSIHKPIAFVLSTGADPRVELEQLALNEDMRSNLVIRSLGQG